MRITREFQLSGLDEATRSIGVVASTRDYVLAVEKDDKGNAREVYESVTEWDLERFAANPVVLWAHDASKLPIGTAADVKITELGLEMRIKFPPAEANPESEQVWQAVRHGLVRAVSVGFDKTATLTEELRDGAAHRTVSASLHELSVVPVPADANALARQRASLQPDGSISESERAETEDERKARLSAAAKSLASARKPRQDADEEVLRYDFQVSADRFQRLDSGGIRVPARLARIGIQEYRRVDGSMRRELRLPEEVFAEDSLTSLRSVPVTDLHPSDLVNPKTWRNVAIGHAESVSHDERFVAGDLVIHDAAAIESIERGERRDVSCGYRCKLDHTPGVWNGERYDAIQRSIRYNHVAIGPSNWGRAGSDVGLRLDSTDAVCVEEKSIMKVIKIDGKELDYGSEAHIQHLEQSAQSKLDAKDAREKELVKTVDELQAKCDAKDKECSKKEAELEEERKNRSSAIRARARLLRQVLRFIDESEDEEKTDSLSDRELMVLAIRKDDKDFVDADKSDDYIRAMFDMTLKAAAKSTSVGAVVTAIEEAKRVDAQDPVEAARLRMIERNRNAWKAE
jgi:uncharacterized protein